MDNLKQSAEYLLAKNVVKYWMEKVDQMHKDLKAYITENIDNGVYVSEGVEAVVKGRGRMQELARARGLEGVMEREGVAGLLQTRGLEHLQEVVPGMGYEELAQARGFDELSAQGLGNGQAGQAFLQFRQLLLQEVLPQQLKEQQLEQCLWSELL
eukprot:GSA25T00003242001.1